MHEAAGRGKAIRCNLKYTLLLAASNQLTNNPPQQSNCLRLGDMMSLVCDLLVWQVAHIVAHHCWAKLINKWLLSLQPWKINKTKCDTKSYPSSRMQSFQEETHEFRLSKLNKWGQPRSEPNPKLQP
jgi:hypothetical protein